MYLSIVGFTDLQRKKKCSYKMKVKEKGLQFMILLNSTEVIV